MRLTRTLICMDVPNLDVRRPIPGLVGHFRSLQIVTLKQQLIQTSCSLGSKPSASRDNDTPADANMLWSAIYTVAKSRVCTPADSNISCYAVYAFSRTWSWHTSRFENVICGLGILQIVNVHTSVIYSNRLVLRTMLSPNREVGTPANLEMLISRSTHSREPEVCTPAGDSNMLGLRSTH